LFSEGKRRNIGGGRNVTFGEFAESRGRVRTETKGDGNTKGEKEENQCSARILTTTNVH